MNFTFSTKRKTYNTLDDKELFKLITLNNEGAFTELYQRYASSLYSALIYMLKDDELVQDVIQDVFCKIWSDRKTIPIPDQVKGFLFITMRNNALNIIKKEQNRFKIAYELAQGETSFYIHDSIEEDEKDKLLQQELKKLPQNMQNIIHLKQEKLSNQEIALKLNMPINTVTVYYSRALKILKKNMAIYNIVLGYLVVFI